MTNGLKQRCIDLLEQDASQAHKAAQAWKELQKDGAWFKDLQQGTITTAADMATRYTEREEELRALIARIKAS